MRVHPIFQQALEPFAPKPAQPNPDAFSVRTLDWVKNSYGNPEAPSVCGTYLINDAFCGGFTVLFRGRALPGPDTRSNYATVDDAKAAAQADFKSRILSAITAAE